MTIACSTSAITQAHDSNHDLRAVACVYVFVCTFPDACSEPYAELTAIRMAEERGTNGEGKGQVSTGDGWASDIAR